MPTTDRVKYNSRLRGELKSAGRAYVNLLANQKRSKLKSESSLQAERTDYFDAYQSLFEQVIDYYYKNNKWELGRFDMWNGILALNAYIVEKKPPGVNQILSDIDENTNQNQSRDNTGQASDANAQTNEADEKHTMLDELKKKVDNKTYSDEQGEEQLNENMGNISEAQMKGLNEISKWYYRNVDKVGMKLGGLSFSESAYEFVNSFILKQPARMKLLAYYLVEKGKRHNPDMLDIVESQTSYVPNLDEFKNKIIATKFKFWKRIDGSYIYWEKLGDAMRFAKDSKISAMLSDMGGYESGGNVQNNTAGNAQQPANSPNAGNAGTSSTLSSAVQERESYYKRFLKAAVEYRTIDNDRSLSKDEKTSQLTAKSSEITSLYNDMRAADIKIVEEEMLHEAVDDSKKTDTATDIIDAGQSAVETSGKPLDIIGGTIAHLGDANDEGSKGITAQIVDKFGWNLAKFDLPIFQKLTMIAGSTASITALATCLIKFVDSAKHWNRASGGEIFQDVVDTLNNLGSVAEKVTSAVLVGKQWAEKGAMTAASLEKVLDKPMAAASIGTGSLGMVAATVHGTASLSRLDGTSSIEKSLKNGGIADKNDAETAADINALQARIASAHAKTAAYDLASSGLQTVGGILSLCGVSSIIGTLISAAGIAVNIAKSIHEFFLKRDNRNETIDTYLGISKVEQEIRDKLQQLEEQCKQNNEKNPNIEVYNKQLTALHELMSGDRLRDELRIRGAAMSGFPSKESFYVKIVGDYATFLYSRLFLKSNGEVITEQDVNDERNGSDNAKKKERKIYEDMLENSGLRAKYPKERTGKPKPSVANIARKLKI